MSVTVVGRWHVPAGREDQVVAAARRAFVAPAEHPSARASAQVFQAIDDAQALLYVSEWADRTAFDLYRAAADPGTVEAVIREAGEFLVCQRLLFFGNYAHRARVTGCAIFEAPSDTDDIVRDLLLPNGRWFGHGLPGLVHYSVYREMTHHHRYVIVHGWQSESALLALRERPRLEHEALQKVGGSVIRFTGYERASTDLL